MEKVRRQPTASEGGGGSMEPSSSSVYSGNIQDRIPVQEEVLR